MATDAESVNGPEVLVVEDESSISTPLCRALQRAGFSCRHAASSEDARRMLAERHPDLILLDLTLPDGDGRDIAREVRSDSELPIIMLTARGAEADRVIGLELGADDYVVKPFSLTELIARIRAVLRRTGRTRADTPREVLTGGLRIEPQARRVSIGGEAVELTRKEFDLLAMLAKHLGEVVRREAIMSEVWDENWFGSTKTLDVHTSSLRRKLGDNPAEPLYIQTVRGVGLMLAAVPPTAPSSAP